MKMKMIKNVIYFILAVFWEAKAPTRKILQKMLKSIVDILKQLLRMFSIVIIIIATGLEMPNLKKRAERILVFFGGSVEDEY